MPSQLAFKGLNRFHKVVQVVSFGRLGWRAGGMPVVELTTTGRRSGEPRTVMLTSPLLDDDRIVLVASRGGDEHHPAWFLNLRTNPHVTARAAGGPARAMVARVPEGDERDALWDELTAVQPRYAGYQSKTDRQIPVVVLDPSASPRSGDER